MSKQPLEYKSSYNKFDVTPPVPTGGGGLTGPGGSVFVAHVPVSVGTGALTGTASVSTMTHLPSGQGIHQGTIGFKFKF